MNRFDALIAELCPNGVTFAPLREVGTWYGGGTPSKSRRDFWSGGTIPWISPKDMGRPVVDTAEDHITEAAVNASATKIVPAVSVAMVVRSSILDRVFPTALVPVPVALNQDMKAVVPRLDILPSYLAYLLRSRGDAILRAARKTGGSVSSIDTKSLFAFSVPVPPVELQREIVRILDMFTELESELEAELESELDARRRQYEHYRRTLLRFAPDYPSARISSLVHGVSSGSNKSRVEGGRYPVYGSTGPIGSTNTAAYSKEALLVARVGANAGRVSAVDGRYDVSDNTLIVSPTSAWNLRFAFHQLTHIDLNQYAVRGGQPLVTGRTLKSLEVAVPPIEEQEEIARVLDALDALVNDLSIGLPAELAARRKQYEHYRDKLLRFKELSRA